MTEPALKLELIEQTQGELKDPKDTILETHTAEIIIGLCGPIGTDIHFVADNLQRILINDYGYICKKIKLSDLIRKHLPKETEQIPLQSKFDSIQELINGGNDLRNTHKKSILAELAINEIAVLREENKKGDEYKSERVCYIIDSIKNDDELELFRLIYRDIFYFIGLYSTVDVRVRNLEAKGLKTHEVYQLFDRDSGEEFDYGQQVRDTFIEADFFLRIEDSSRNEVELKIKRLFNLIFSSDVITPSTHETAMYLASAAAGSSACLSRQVGAAITDAKGEVISVGWNDVPKVGGSVYQYDTDDPTNRDDKRCIFIKDGICHNDTEKAIISDLLVKDLIAAGVITTAQQSQVINIVKKSRIKELIEFSRAVHAEMLAIILGSQKAGNKMVNGKLYCTTYPCHNCARHIVAAGIKEIYYIEPYRKSLATKLHSDSITEDETKIDLVRILMFDGVSPRRYLEFFKMLPNSRKKNGEKIISATKHISPKKTLSLQAIPYLEGKITEDLKIKRLINV